jgi:hypothetical protein
VSLQIHSHPQTRTQPEAFFKVAGRLEKKTLEHKTNIKVVFQINRRYTFQAASNLKLMIGRSVGVRLNVRPVIGIKSLLTLRCRIMNLNKFYRLISTALT